MVLLFFIAAHRSYIAPLLPHTIIIEDILRESQFYSHLPKYVQVAYKIRTQ